MIFAQMIGIMFITTIVAFLGGYVGVALASIRQAQTGAPFTRDFEDLARRVLAVLGILIVVVGLCADTLGLSASHGIGFLQSRTILLGAAIMGIASVITVRRKSTGRESPRN